MAGVFDSIGQIAGGVLSFGVILIVMLVIGSLIAISFIIYFQWKKFQEYKVIIWERDAFGQMRQTTDEAGIFVDKKTNNKRFFLRKNNVGLQPDNVPFVPLPNGKKMVYLVKRGLKNFQYIQPVLTDNEFKFNVTEEDVNWAVNAYERQKKLFNNDKLLQYMPFIILAFISIVIMVIFIYFFKNFGVLKEVALAFKDAAVQFAQAKSGIIQ